ncbi:hypothetical protein BDQ17DRAFT_1230890 [Cyathus striatus]|nr:hypothetical protein BDQ17DRAFT_1230890 [Cyathus striatus]
MDIDDLKPGPSSRKRKRGIQADLPVATRASARRSKPKKTSNTPVVRQSKRLRSVTATVASEEDAREGTRVFAVWMGDGHFYAAKVHSHVKEDQFKLYFDDDTTSVVPITQMRSFSLRIGDEVLTGGSSRPYKVVGLEDGYVKIRNDDETVTRELSLIRISGKTIECEWKDRILLMNNVMTMSGPVKLTTSPTPSRLLVANTIPKPAKRMPLSSKKVLAKTGLVVTLSVTNDNWGSDKVNIINSIRSAGGIVVDDFSSVINMEGKHAYNNNQWVIEKKDVKWIGDKNIERLFLIADDANQKPKFLIALALGIPCLSRSWVDDCIGKGEDREWLTYTLPQGYSAALNGRPSQQVDVDWGNSIHYLKDIMSNSVPCKLFSKMSILVLGADMVPMPKGKCVSFFREKAQEAHNALARIILAMGASRVEAVSDLKYASATTADYDLIVIRDADRYTQELPSHTTVHWTWVKDCLVASRFLSRPQWCYIDLENSQEA